MRMNALHNCKNPFQGSEKKVLTICSAGLLRSPTLAWFLSQHNYNTRSCGLHDYALIQLDEILLEWADIIIVVEKSLYDQIDFDNYQDKQILIFDIPDEYEYKDPNLLLKLEEECIKYGLITDE